MISIKDESRALQYPFIIYSSAWNNKSGWSIKDNEKTENPMDRFPGNHLWSRSDRSRFFQSLSSMGVGWIQSRHFGACCCRKHFYRKSLPAMLRLFFSSSSTVAYGMRVSDAGNVIKRRSRISFVARHQVNFKKKIFIKKAIFSAKVQSSRVPK